MKRGLLVGALLGVLVLSSAFAGSPPTERVYIDVPEQGSDYRNSWPTFSGRITGTSDQTVGEILIYCVQDDTEYYWNGSDWVTEDPGSQPLCSGNDCATWSYDTAAPPVEGTCYVLVTATSTGVAYADATFYFHADPTDVEFIDLAYSDADGYWHATYEIRGVLDSGHEISYHYTVIQDNRDIDCSSLNFDNLSNDAVGIYQEDPMIYEGYKMCVLVKNQYGKKSWASVRLESPGVTIEEPEAREYVNDWPEFTGALSGYMDDSSVEAELKCGDYYWNGEDWVAEATTFEPAHGSNSWSFFTDLPPEMGACVVTVWHRAEHRTDADASVTFTFSKTPVDIEVRDPSEWPATGTGYTVLFDLHDSLAPYDVYSGRVERNGECGDLEYVGEYSGSTTIPMAIDWDERACVRAVDVYGQESVESAVLPEPGVSVEEPEEYVYEDEWPDDVYGELDAWMRGSEVVYRVECNGLYWNGEDWSESEAWNTAYVDAGSWEGFVYPPPRDGDCHFLVTHRDERRGEANAMVDFRFEKSAPEIDVEDPENWVLVPETNAYDFGFEVWDSCVEGWMDEYCGDYNVYVGTGENCEDANYVYVGTYPEETWVPLEGTVVYGTPTCIRALNMYGKETVERVDVPDIEPYIENEESAYFDDWPEEIAGGWEPEMDGDEGTLSIVCTGSAGTFYWSGEDWSEENIYMDVGSWWSEETDLPPTTGTCTVTLHVSSPGRPAAEVTWTFSFDATEPSVDVELAEGEPVANGCMRDEPVCKGTRNVEVEFDLTGWGPVEALEARCNDGNWIASVDVPEEFNVRVETTMRDLNTLFPGIYEECMVEGDLRMEIRVTDHFGRSATGEDEVQYHRDAWKITYELGDGWNFIGMPVIPYTPLIDETTEGNVEGVWLFDARAQSWKVHRIGRPEVSSFSEYEQGRAYMVDVNGEATLSIWGHYEPETDTDPPMPSVIFTVYRGWNPVSFDLKPMRRGRSWDDEAVIDSSTAFSAVHSKEIYTMGDPGDPWEFGGSYHVIMSGGVFWVSPVYGTKGYWLYTTDDNVDVHSKHNVYWGCCE